MSSIRSTCIVLLLLALLVGTAYANSLQDGFAFDDQVMILENTLLTDLGYLPKLLTSDYWAGRRAPSEAVPWRSGLYRPLVLATFSLNYAWGKWSPVGYHLANVLIHLMVTWLVYLIGCQLGLSRGASFVAAAIFAVHPLHTEAVTAIVGRAELLMAGGVLAALWFAGLGRRNLSLSAFAIALLSKEQAMIVPVLLLLHDVCFERRTPHAEHRSLFPFGLRTALFRYSPYLLVLGGYLLVRGAVLGQFGVVPPHFIDNPLAHVDAYTRLLNALKVAGLYLWLCVWPETLSADYSYNAIPLAGSLRDPGVLLAVFAWGLLLGIAAWSFVRGDRRISFSIAFMVVTFLPVSNLLIPIGTIMGERLFYLPSAGLCLLAGLVYERLLTRLTSRVRLREPAALSLSLNFIPPVTVAVVSLLLIQRTIERNRDWFDTESLMRSALVAYPASAKVHGVLGGLTVAKADWEKARDHLQTAMGLYPEYTNTEIAINLNLGTMFLKTNQVKDAIRAFERAVVLDPTSSKTLFNLGAAYSAEQRYEEAADFFRGAILVNPEFADAHSGLSWVLIMSDQHAEALAEADRALQLKPDFRDARLNRARALEGLGRMEEARSEILREGGGVTEPGLLGRRRK